MYRRDLLVATGVGLSSLAGCLGDSSHPADASRECGPGGNVEAPLVTLRGTRLADGRYRVTPDVDLQSVDSVVVRHEGEDVVTLGAGDDQVVASERSNTHPPLRAGTTLVVVATFGCVESTRFRWQVSAGASD